MGLQRKYFAMFPFMAAAFIIHLPWRGSSGTTVHKHGHVVLMGNHFYVCRHEGVPHSHPQQQTQQQLQPGGMNPPEGRCGTPPATGSPDRLDKATLKVHLPNGGFNVVKFGDAIDVKVSQISFCTARFVCGTSVTQKGHHLLYKLASGRTRPCGLLSL
jgi:hypothetical protein